MNSRSIRILHLSDLHFGSTFETALWDYVQQMLSGAEHPDVIVVTGDLVDSPSLFMLAAARNELEYLAANWARASKRPCQVVVVPGNHDRGILGNLALPVLRRKFDVVFGSGWKSHLAKIPRYTDYIRKQWYRRWGLRSYWFIGCFLLRFFRVVRASPRGARLQEVCDRALRFALFDSNAGMALATGRINENDFLSLHQQLLSLRPPTTSGQFLNLVPRIALVHHHVVPIPHSTTVESVTSFEPFLVLRNAGTLLKELCLWDFDLALHGHKHLLNFVRLSFDSADEAISELGVLAAGSATKRQSQAGKNSFNLIKVQRNGCISFRSVSYGAGATGYIENLWSARFRTLLPLAEIKIRAYARAVGGLEITCDIDEHQYEVDADGSADVLRRITGMRSPDDSRLLKRIMRAYVTQGAIARVRLDAKSSHAGHALQQITTLPTRSLECQLALATPSSNFAAGVDFGIEFRMINNFVISQWECNAVGLVDGCDRISAVIRYPTKKLRLTVHLPNNLINLRPALTVERYVDYPVLTVDALRDIMTPDKTLESEKDAGISLSDSWIRDADYTEFEKPNLTCVEGALIAEVDYPMVGFKYSIRWHVESKSTATTPARSGLAAQLRKSMLAVRFDPLRESLRSQANEQLASIAHEVYLSLLGSKYAFDECLEVALFVYNEDANTPVLQLVSEGCSRPPETPRVEQIPLNAGITGAAFKRRRITLFVAPDLAGTTHDGVYVYFPDSIPVEERPKHAAFLAVPLYLSDLEEEDDESEELAGDRLPTAPEEVLGVLTIATNAKDNKLLSLLRDGQGSNLAIADHDLLLSIWAVAVQYIAVFCEEIQDAANVP